MGNTGKSSIQNQQKTKNQIDINHSRFIKQENYNNNKGNKIIVDIPQFVRLDNWEIELEGLTLQQQKQNNIKSFNVYFRTQQDFHKYLSSIVTLKQICDINLYDQLQIKEQNSFKCISVNHILTKSIKLIDKSEFKGNYLKIFDLLIFLSKILIKTRNCFIIPSQIYETNDTYIIKSFSYKKIQMKKLLKFYLIWLLNQQQFDKYIQQEEIINLPADTNIYLKQLLIILNNDNKISKRQIYQYFIRLKQKYRYLQGNFDSIYSCLRSKKTKYYVQNYNQWLIAKKNNQVYMYNTQDSHVCQGRIIRKSRKINIEHTHLIFDNQQFQVMFLLQGTKNLVKTSQFEIQDCFTISDIQIKHKLPLRFRNPFLFKYNKNIYIFQQMVFKYNLQQNKLYQLSKKINDCICFVSSTDFQFLIIRVSIDIFKNGIMIYASDCYQILKPSGNLEMANDIENIKIDIKHVQFCIQICKGVYLMLASRNLWILDLNFMVFFSFVSIQRLKQFCRNKSQNSQQKSYAFQILNQPFYVNWLTHHNGINIIINQDIINIIGTIANKLFYLKYQIIYEAGMLKLLEYSPLFRQQVINSIRKTDAISNSNNKQLYFNVYTQIFDFVTNINWIHKGNCFVDVRDIKISTNKTFTQFILSVQPTLINLKDLIQQISLKQIKWSNQQKSIALYKIFQIFQQLIKKNIAHKNFNLNNLWITQTRQLKLSGWSQPPKNWHISDYKDFLLVCFNIIAQSNYQKLTDKIIDKHEKQLGDYSILLQKMNYSLKNKQVQKKADLDKHLHNIQDFLNNQIFKITQNFKDSSCIFSFQYNTPRFSMYNIEQGKIKKMMALFEGQNNTEQFTFKNKDQYVWNQNQSTLYIFTINYQMYSLKINIKDFKEQSLILQQFQYLPNNIVDCTFITTPNGLFAFGGIMRQSKKKINFAKNIYHFCKQKLTWIAVAKMQPRILPKVILSQNKQNIYIMGGEHDIPNQNLQVFIFNIKSKSIQKMIDCGFKNPLKSINQKQFTKLFQISEDHNIFMIWTISNSLVNFKIFSSIISGFQINMQGKIYLDDGSQLPPVSISYAEGGLHFLRPYGKYTKISVGKLDAVTVFHKTVYSN